MTYVLHLRGVVLRGHFVPFIPHLVASRGVKFVVLERHAVNAYVVVEAHLVVLVPEAVLRVRGVNLGVVEVACHAVGRHVLAVNLHRDGRARGQHKLGVECREVRAVGHVDGHFVVFHAFVASQHLSVGLLPGLVERHDVAFGIGRLVLDAARQQGHAQRRKAEKGKILHLLIILNLEL